MISAFEILQETTRGGYGYRYFDDTLPGSDPIEAAAFVSSMLAEQAVELINDDAAETQAIVEATMGGYLPEFSFSEIIEKIKSFFKKLLNWIKGLIAKARVWIDTLIKTGPQLWNKYSDKLKDPSYYKGLSFNGWDFTKAKSTDDTGQKTTDIEKIIVDSIGELTNNNDLGNYPKVAAFFVAKLTGINPDTEERDMAKSYISISDKKLLSGDYTPDDKAGSSSAEDLNNEDTKALNKYREDLEKVDSEKRRRKFASKILNGFEVGDAGDWKTKVSTKLHGTSEKVSMDYNQKCFTRSWLESVLKDPKNPKDIRSTYDAFYDHADKLRDAVEKSADDFETKITRNFENHKGGMAASSAANIFKSYTQAYLSWINDCTGMMNEFISLRSQALKDKNNQAKAMLGAMLRYGGDKDAKKEDYEAGIALEAMAFTI